MYEDRDHWPQCSKEFVDRIGEFKAGKRLRCPWCEARLPVTGNQFCVALARARAGELDPWASMTKIRRMV